MFKQFRRNNIVKQTRTNQVIRHTELLLRLSDNSKFITLANAFWALTYSPFNTRAPWLSLAGHPRNAYDMMPSTEMTPTITFHAARYLARGLYLEMTRPERRMPKAENTKPTVPRRNFGNVRFRSPASLTIIFQYIYIYIYIYTYRVVYAYIYIYIYIHTQWCMLEQT
jgi:hypothetical protein